MSAEKETPTLSPKTKITLGSIGGGILILFWVGWWASGITHKLDSILVFQQSLAAQDAKLEGKVDAMRVEFQTKFDVIKDRVDKIELVGSPAVNDLKKRVDAIERKP